jgi:hypothetical protein
LQQNPSQIPFGADFGGKDNSTSRFATCDKEFVAHLAPKIMSKAALPLSSPGAHVPCMSIVTVIEWRPSRR